MRKPVKKTARRKTSTAPSSSKKKTPKTKSLPSKVKKTTAKPIKGVTGKKSASKTRVAKSVLKSPKPKAGKAETAKRVVKKKTATSKQKKSSSLRDKKLQLIKLNLLKQKTSLLDEAEIALNELPGQTIFPDLGDQASAETDRNFMLRLRGREQRLLKKIEEAIDRIDAGTFGICEDCGKEIGIKRLEARPVTSMCIECKTVQEEEEKLRAS
jgi:DnaK suppressor protein